MTADVELLPLPAIDSIVKYVEDYARANVSHAIAEKDAEIEALTKGLRVAAISLAHASETDATYRPAYQHVSDLLAGTHIADAGNMVEALLAEVDRLEAESQSWLEACGDAVSKLCAAEARAERLSEAGRRVTAAFRAHGETSPFTREAEITRYECQDAMLSLDAALKQEAK